MSLFDLDYGSIKVMSKEDDYDGKHYNSVELTIESMAYLNFPREREMLVSKSTDRPVAFLKDLFDAQRAQLDVAGETTYHVPEKDGVSAYDVVVVLEKNHPLIKAFRMEVPVPNILKMPDDPAMSMEERAREEARVQEWNKNEKGKLQDWSEEAMTSAVRAAAARITWMEANENQEAFKDEVEKCYLQVNSALIKAGFRPSGIKLAIKLIDPPVELKRALAGVEAAAHVAKRESVEVGDAFRQMVSARIIDEVGVDAVGKANKISIRRRKEIEQECLNLVTRDRTMKQGGKLKDVRVASADGSSFGKGSLAEIVGGIVAAVTASRDQGGGQGGEQERVGDNQRGNRRGINTPVIDVTPPTNNPDV
jgi:hypothetical protein